MRVQILTKKGYEKSKQQLEALSKRKTFLICGFGSIQGLSHAWDCPVAHSTAIAP